MIDLDTNATTPLLPEVLEAMMPWLGGGHANPSGAYRAARQAREAIELARLQVAALLEAEAGEVVFTSGGTESVNTALRSMDALCGPGALVVSAIEHSAVLRCAERLGREVRHAPVTSGGVLDLVEFQKLLDGAAMVSVMAANNETGVVQPLAEVVALAHDRGLPVHSDAVQAAGKMTMGLGSLGVDLLSVTAHKFYGPKGTGALFIRRGLPFHPWLWGGGQERGRRSGTENTPGIVGMGAAAEMSHRWLATAGPADLAAIRNAFEHELRTQLTGVTSNGDPSCRLPNTSHLSFAGCDAAGLLILLDEAGIQCSAGSACMTGKSQPSHVQRAMGIPDQIARGSLRFSFSRIISPEQARIAAGAVVAAVKKLRRVQGYGVGPVTVYSE